MIIKKRSTSIIILDILLVLVYLNPVADLFPSYFQIAVFILWAFINVNNRKLWGKAIPLTIVNVGIFVASLLRCMFAGQLNTSYYSTFQVVIARYQVMIYPILYIYISGRDKEEKKHVFKLAMFCIIGTILVSLYYIFAVDPQAIRNTQRDVALFGVGDFMLMYAMAIAVGPLTFLIFKRKKEHKKIFWNIVSLLLISVCLILCNLVTSVVIAIISIMVTYIINCKDKRVLIVLGILLLGAFVLRSYIADFLYYVASMNLFYWSTNNKIVAIANVLNGDMNHIDTLSRRFMLADWSLKSFFEHPVFGINWKNHQYGVIGCHMQWADDLGRYGLFGNIIIFINYLYMANYTIKKSENIFIKNSMRVIWTMFFILGFLNPCLSATNLMMIFVVIPAMDGLIAKKED